MSTPPMILKPKPPRGCLSSSTYLSCAITRSRLAVDWQNSFPVTTIYDGKSGLVRSFDGLTESCTLASFSNRVLDRQILKAQPYIVRIIIGKNDESETTGTSLDDGVRSTKRSN